MIQKIIVTLGRLKSVLFIVLITVSGSMSLTWLLFFIVERPLPLIGYFAGIGVPFIVAPPLAFILVNMIIGIDDLKNQLELKTLDLKNTLNQLKASKDRYRFLVENTSDIIWSCDKNLRLNYISPNSENIRGYSQAESLGMGLDQLMTPESAEIVNRRWTDRLSQSYYPNTQDVQVEAEIYHKNGSTIWVDLKAKMVMDQNDPQTSLIGIARDISKRKQAEFRLKEMHQRQVQVAHRAGIANIATDMQHNVGNLLNSIKTSSHVIKELVNSIPLVSLKKANDLLRDNMGGLGNFFNDHHHGKLLPEYYFLLEKSLEKYTQELSANITRQNQKINTVGDLIHSQMLDAGLDQWFEDCSLPEVIEEVLVIHSEMLKKHGIEIKKLFEARPRISAQKVKLQHILINLIQNAADAMEHCTSDKRIINIRLTVDECNLKISIQDFGKGIEAKDLIRIFSQGYAGKNNGTGCSFSLHRCANYISEMNGRIWAASDGIDKGATFFLELPNSIIQN